MIHVHLFDKNDRLVVCLKLPESYTEKSIDEIANNYVIPVIESFPEWLYGEIVKFSISFECRKESNETKDLFD